MAYLMQSLHLLKQSLESQIYGDDIVDVNIEKQAFIDKTVKSLKNILNIKWESRFKIMSASHTWLWSLYAGSTFPGEGLLPRLL